MFFNMKDCLGAILVKIFLVCSIFVGGWKMLLHIVATIGEKKLLHPGWNVLAGSSCSICKMV